MLRIFQGDPNMRPIVRFLVSIGMLLAGAVPGHAEEQATVRLKWLHQAQFAGYYVAKDKGYYEKAGLDVSIQPGGSDFPAIQMVAGGSEQFGVTGADQILRALDSQICGTASSMAAKARGLGPYGFSFEASLATS